MDTPDTPPGDVPKSGELRGWALGVAVFLVGAWVAVLSLLLYRVDGANDVQWARMIVVLSSIQAAAFAAAGALFGTKIQDQRVSDATGRAKDAEQRANKAQTDATKGKVLSDAIKAKAAASNAGADDPGGVERMRREGVSDRVERPVGTAPDKDLLALAQRLFPDG
ncbi:MAG TPA: hypothetical protein VGD56_13250 [Gemmatirosa sp.]